MIQLLVMHGAGEKRKREKAAKENAKNTPAEEDEEGEEYGDEPWEDWAEEDEWPPSWVDDGDNNVC